MIEDDSALRLRPECGDDLPFLKSLYQSTREDLALIGLPGSLFDGLIEMQFQAQRKGHFGQYPQAQSFIVERCGKSIGSLLKSENECEIRLLYIALVPGERGKGYGRKLLSSLQQEGKLLRLSVDPLNSPARNLYSSLGFRTEGQGGANLEMIWP